MARLTGGTFKYTRRIKPGDPNEYNAPFREATAEISWCTSEDEGQGAEMAIMDSAQQEAVARVHEMLGGKGKTHETSVEPTNTAAPAKAVVKKEPVQEKSLTLETEAEEDPMGEDPNIPPVAPISTKELVDAVTLKNAERLARAEGSTMADGRDARSPLIIRELVAKYVTSPKTSKDIPQEVRAQFLKELKAL